MSSEPTEAHLKAAGTTYYALPQAILFATAAFGYAPLAIAALLVVPLALPRNWLLMNWFGLSLINFALFTTGAGWIGLLSTYYYGLVLCVRLDVFTRGFNQIIQRNKLESAGIFLITASFVVLSRAQYFVPTAIKSSLQLAFLLGLSIALREMRPDWMAALRRQALVVLPSHMMWFGLASILLWQMTGTDDRFGGMSGPQVGAFTFSVIFTFFWFAGQKPYAYASLFLVALTGSRTYVGIVAIVLFAPLVAARARLGVKVFTGVVLVALLVVGWSLLPYVSTRFVMNDEFYGTLLGRLLNYTTALDHISASPYFGEGMGSIVRVLENWIPELFEYYAESGDTTVMHNEYLRVAMETGLVGCAIACGLAWRALRNSSPETRTLTAVFLISSLTENTLSAYSTAMLTLLLAGRMAASQSRRTE